MQWAAIDFETANASRDSACAIGVALAEGGDITESRRWLIRPPTLEFDEYNVYIHGITPEDVTREPRFDAIWPEISEYVRGRTLLAHNASFDMSVLRATLDAYEVPYPDVEYLCTRVIAKKLWPGEMSSYGLPIVAAMIVIRLTHHDPVSDAEACAEIALHAVRETGA